jgi:hypothetical protein
VLLSRIRAGYQRFRACNEEQNGGQEICRVEHETRHLISPNPNALHPSPETLHPNLLNLGEHAIPKLGPQLGVRVTKLVPQAAGSKDMPLSANARGLQRLKAAFRQSHEKVYLELFAGSGRVAKEWTRQGRRGIAVDIRHGLRVNLLKTKTVRFLARQMKRGHVGAVWLGTPCSSFSLARRGRAGSPGGPLRTIGRFIRGHPAALKRPLDRKKIRLGNLCAKVTAKLAESAHENRIPWAIENPAGSRLWHVPAIQRLSQRQQVERRVACMCAYGRPYKKPTAVLAGLCHGPGLRRPCPGCEEHVILQGSSRTSEAQVYPVSFAQEAANLLVNVGAKRQRKSQRRLPG